jgi:hypothetical protein
MLVLALWNAMTSSTMPAVESQSHTPGKTVIQVHLRSPRISLIAIPRKSSLRRNPQRRKVLQWAGALGDTQVGVAVLIVVILVTSSVIVQNFSQKQLEELEKCLEISL